MAINDAPEDRRNVITNAKEVVQEQVRDMFT